MVLLDQYLEECKTNEDKSKKLDEISSIYNKGIIEGQKHQKPSPQTVENLGSINKRMQNIETHLEYIKQSIDDNKGEHDKIFNLLEIFVSKTEEKIEKLDSKYARIDSVNNLEKIIEKQEVLVNKVLWTSITSLIGFLVMIIISLIKMVL